MVLLDYQEVQQLKEFDFTIMHPKKIIKFFRNPYRNFRKSLEINKILCNYYKWKRMLGIPYKIHENSWKILKINERIKIQIYASSYKYLKTKKILER